MKRINVNLWPKGGYTFREADGTTIAGTTWEGVIARVRAYRQRNGQPPGDAQAEVMAQACAANPGLCVEEGAVYREQLKRTNLKSRILAWFADLRKRVGKLAFVDEHEAKRRAGICRVCPMRQELPEGCSSCRAAVTALRLEILGKGRDAESYLVQTGCLVLGSELATAVHLDGVTVENPDLPAACWRKRTL